MIKVEPFKPMSITIDKDLAYKMTGNNFFALGLIDFCRKKRIGIKEPKGEDGRYHTLTLSFKTEKQWIAFDNKYSNIYPDICI